MTPSPLPAPPTSPAFTDNTFASLPEARKGEWAYEENNLLLGVLPNRCAEPFPPPI